MRGPWQAAAAGAALAVTVVAAAPWLQAGGRELPALWLEAGLQLLALVLLGGAALAGRLPAPSALVAWLPAAVVWTLSAWGAGYLYAARLACFEAALALALALTLPALLAGGAGRRLRLRLATWLPLAALPAALAAVALALSGRRGAAGFVNPNHLGAYLLALLPLTLVAGGAAWRRLLLGSALLAGLLATGSRGALAAAAALALAATLAGARAGLLAGRRRRLAAAGAALFLLAAGAAMALRFADGSDIYRYDRLRIWPRAVAAAGAAPVLGMGPGQFAHRAPAWNFPRDGEAVRFGRVFHSPHSHLLLLVVETGAAGLAAFLAGLLLALRRARRGWRRRPGPQARVALAAASGLAGVAVISLVDEPLAGMPVLLTASVLAGLALPPARLRPAPAPVLRAVLAAGLAAAAVGLVVQPTRAHHQAVRAAGLSDPVARVARLSRAVRLAPGQAVYPLAQAEVLLALARRPLDLRSYARIRLLADRATELDPARAAALLLTARLERRACIELLRRERSCQRSAGFYRRAAAAAPTDPRILREAASFARLLSREGEAAELLRRAVELEPAYVAAWSDLVEVERQRAAGGAGLEQAVAGLDRARRQAAAAVPDSPYARDILHRNGITGTPVAVSGGA